MQLISVDIEADGPIPYKYSMISLGAVNVYHGQEFYATIAPISNDWVPEALAVSGFTREETEQFTEAKQVMLDFERWLLSQKREKDRLTFMSDNAGFDWMFVAFYFHYFLGRNPFGFSPMSLTWFAKGLERHEGYNRWKKLRTTKHSHNALDDAKGNAEAYLKLKEIHDVG